MSTTFVVCSYIPRPSQLQFLIAKMETACDVCAMGHVVGTFRPSSLCYKWSKARAGKGLGLYCYSQFVISTLIGELVLLSNLIKVMSQALTSFTPVSGVTIQCIVGPSLNNLPGTGSQVCNLRWETPSFYLHFCPEWQLLDAITASVLKAHRMNGCPNYLLSWEICP